MYLIYPIYKGKKLVLKFKVINYFPFSQYSKTLIFIKWFFIFYTTGFILKSKYINITLFIYGGNNLLNSPISFIFQKINRIKGKKNTENSKSFIVFTLK